MNYPTEGALNWELELNALKERGVEQINLIISDALQGLERAVCSAFSQAAHQFCVVRFKRHVLKQVTKKDKEKLLVNLEKEMKEAAKVLDFERAAELRDILIELRNS